MELHILIGLPSNKKTTIAKNLCIIQKKFIRINDIEICNMYSIPINRKEIETNELILNAQINLIENAFKNNYNVVLDSIIFEPNIYNKLIHTIKNKYNIDILFTCIQTSIEEAITLEENKQIPKKDLIDLYKEFIEYKTDKEIIEYLQNEKLEPLTIKYLPVKHKRKTNLDFKNAIIVDLDGTIVDINESKRDNYDNTLNDKPRMEIIKIIKGYTDYYDDINIIVITARPSSCLEQTISWLDKNFSFYNLLYMRNKNDNRCDVTIKEEIYLEHIKDNYNILAVFEDRKKVVDMWRKNNLNTLQVAEGNY
jgi:hypothetical protein